MKKKKRKNNRKLIEKREKRPSRFSLPEEIKRLIWSVAMFLAAVIISLAFFEKAGAGGKYFMRGLTFLFGKAAFVLPLLFVLGGMAFFGLKHKNKWPIILAVFLLILGISGIFEGGWLGFVITWPFLKGFGQLATRIIFGALILLGIVILWQFLYRPSQAKITEGKQKPEKTKPPMIKRIFGPKFKVKPVTPEISYSPPEAKENLSSSEFKTRPIEALAKKDYKLPPIDLLEADRGAPTTGDIRVNSTIIKRTLQNFDIPVEMSEVNVGPTVTQYTLKPAEGVKLAKITSLANDLSLALASHPIRIEAPIPGKPLVGIEIPNKSRALVRLRNLIEHQNFQNSVSSLTFVLGRDVSGLPVFADLARMPHLLVAGATGTGKTIQLNSVILSLLYQNSPELLKFIMIDPKRVEFPVYNDLPHLLTPVIYNAQKTINALKWLTEEMERRFDIFSQEKARDIANFNEKMASQGQELMPYIIVIVDELADLMAARGREVEAGIVRLAQMARAVGIHLIIATQRPSVEVITGLIKANITSRITFQVASQVDSRTVLDMAGAEKLLGSGDMLFVSAEIVKPKRIQGAYVSPKEVRKVVKYLKQELEETKIEPELVPEKEGLEQALEKGEFEFLGGEDPLYEEAKKVVVEARKASASLLQRRLRIGYARAARLVDTLEERGVVGPGEGAKPREVYIDYDQEKTI